MKLQLPLRTSTRVHCATCYLPPLTCSSTCSTCRCCNCNPTLPRLPPRPPPRARAPLLHLLLQPGARRFTKNRSIGCPGCGCNMSSAPESQVKQIAAYRQAFICSTPKTITVTCCFSFHSLIGLQCACDRALQAHQRPRPAPALQVIAPSLPNHSLMSAEPNVEAVFPHPKLSLSAPGAVHRTCPCDLDAASLLHKQRSRWTSRAALV
jgi:hypothetical protein